MDSSLRDFVETQVGMIDLLLAMYPAEGEVSIDHHTLALIDQLRSWCSENEPCPINIPPSISLLLSLNIDDQDCMKCNLELVLVIEVSLKPPHAAQPDATGIAVKLRQPSWMTRSDATTFAALIPQDDILTAVDYVSQNAPAYNRADLRAPVEPDMISTSRSVVRVWFYFPSLSTREKREDLVAHAPRFGLTGFVLAGKPGILCLEGVAENVDSYMKFIKTESWSDIPSHQKKVSERFREENLTERAFGSMNEITDSLGERRGERANRGDMKALEIWLNERGLDSAFEKVLM